MTVIGGEGRVDDDPTKAERTAACLAMVSFWLCSLVGQLLVLWWARRHGSRFARRYAWASLSLEGIVLLGLIVYQPFFFFVRSAFSVLLVFAVLWLLQLFLGVVAIVLAVRGWRGQDVGDRLLPAAVVSRLPGSSRAP